ncbi:MAG TPA: nuclear transport factor 2 family protein [Chloroflexota bacterium]|nr:nuclear transport factor 2 family protein [Chloroflexota bacterium]
MAGEAAAVLVAGFHQALNGGDVERLVGLAREDVELVGPRGTARGVELLREWVGRAGITLTPRRTFARGQTVVVEEDASWRDPHTGEAQEAQVVATAFDLREGRIARISRLPDLKSALRAAGMEARDEVPQSG